MALHVAISKSLGAKVYFCDSHSPWQRGSNENTNGLLRDYFPKGTDLTVHTADHLAAVKPSSTAGPGVFGDQSPAQLFNALLPSPHRSVLRR